MARKTQPRRKKTSMKKMILAVTTVLLFVGSMAISADAEKSDTEKVDVSKNPITGTQTTTRKVKKNLKTPHGTEQKIEVTEKTKEMKDGTVKQSADVEVDATSKK